MRQRICNLSEFVLILSRQKYLTNFPPFYYIGLQLFFSLTIPGRGIQQFRISGQMFHRLHGEVFPRLTEAYPYPNHQYLQLYYIDPALANRTRNQIFSDLRPDMLQQIQEALYMYNANVRQFVSQYHQILQNGFSQVADMRIVFSEDHTRDQRRFQAPAGLGGGQVYAILPDIGADGSATITHTRDIVVSCQYQPGEIPRTWRISDLNPHFDALNFPLLFPYGETQWSLLLCRSIEDKIPLRHRLSGPDGEEALYAPIHVINLDEWRRQQEELPPPQRRAYPPREGRISMREHAAFRLMTRNYGCNRLLHCYRLSQENKN